MKDIDQNQNWLGVGRSVLDAEAQAIVGVANRLDDNLSRALELILPATGKVFKENEI